MSLFIPSTFEDGTCISSVIDQSNEFHVHVYTYKFFFPWFFLSHFYKVRTPDKLSLKCDSCKITCWQLSSTYS